MTESAGWKELFEEIFWVHFCRFPQIYLFFTVPTWTKAFNAGLLWENSIRILQTFGRRKNISYVKFKLPSLFMDHKRNSKIVLQLKCILVWADLRLWTFWICKEILGKLKMLPHFCSESIMLESLFRNKQACKLGRYYLQNLKTLSTHWLTWVGARRCHRI